MSRPLLSQADRADVFRGLAHPLRRRVLRMLRQQERTVTDILCELKTGRESSRLTMPSLSRHLGVLRDAGLVKQRVVGYRRYYKTVPTPLRRAGQWLQQSA